jgi:anti-sigma factor RsiW
VIPHFGEEQISAYLDKQLDPGEARALEIHLRECESCHGVFDEMRELTNLFRGAEQVKPSPFLWTRIAADFGKERYSWRGWGATLIAGLRRYAWNPGLAAAVFGILMIAGVAVFREVNINVADRAALAEIDKAYQSLAAQNPDSYNPFVSGSPSDFDANPFKSLRLRGRTDSDPLVPVRH